MQVLSASFVLVEGLSILKEEEEAASFGLRSDLENKLRAAF